MNWRERGISSGGAGCVLEVVVERPWEERIEIGYWVIALAVSSVSFPSFCP